MRSARRCVLLGLDSATLDLIDRFSKEGKLPHMRKLMDNGVVSEMFSELPTGTAMNWTSIATGAHTGTHGITEMTVHLPGEPLSKRNSGFTTELCQAEYLWNTVERLGKKVILLRYTASWPPTITEGIQVAGVGNPDWNPFQITPRMIFSTEKYKEREIDSCSTAPGEISRAYQVQLRDASDWKNIPESKSKPMQTTIRVIPKGGKETDFFVLLVDCEGRGYDRMILSREKDAHSSLCVLSPGRWTGWLKADFVTGEGKKTGIFRVKLITLSPDAKSFTLYLNPIMPVSGWTSPDSIAQELVEVIGRPYQSLCDIFTPYFCAWIDNRTYMEEVEEQIDWLKKAAAYLMSHYQWDFFFAQWHGIDFVDHCFLGGMDPESSVYQPDRAKECERVVSRAYELADEYVGTLMENAGEDTLFMIVSDHGHIAPRKVFHCNNLLAREGLLSYRILPNGIIEIDWSKTKVFSPFGPYIFINLRGREENGVVKTDEYEELRTRVIDLFRNVKDPDTGRNIVNMVLKREEAEFLGLYGDRVGDIIYTLDTHYNDETAWTLSKDLPIVSGPFFDSGNTMRPFAGVHHTYLPSPRHRLGTLRAMLIASGPGVRSNYRRNKIARTIDVAPTIAEAFGIDPPRNCDGSVLIDIFER